MNTSPEESHSRAIRIVDYPWFQLCIAVIMAPWLVYGLTVPLGLFSLMLGDKSGVSNFNIILLALYWVVAPVSIFQAISWRKRNPERAARIILYALALVLPVWAYVFTN